MQTDEPASSLDGLAEHNEQPCNCVAQIFYHKDDALAPTLSQLVA